MSFSEFYERFGTEEQCQVALIGMGWPDGFVCPGCGSFRHSWSPARRHCQCSDCRRQTSAKVVTIFHKSKTPLTKWFSAMHLITSAKNAILGLELARQLDVKWDTAWPLRQKLREVMRQRNTMCKLAGDVRIDDAYMGGEKPGKTGRGAGNKVPFVLAVATRDGKPSLHASASREGLHQTGNPHLCGDQHHAGLARSKGLAEVGMRHLPVVAGGGRPKEVRMRWANTGLGNLGGHQRRLPQLRRSTY